VFKFLRKMFGTQAVRQYQARERRFRPQLESLEDRIVPATTFFWDQSGMTNNISETATVNNQLVYINLDAGALGLGHPLASGGLPKAGDTLVFTGQANKPCTIDAHVEAQVMLTHGYNSQITNNGGLVMDSYTDDGATGSKLLLDNNNNLNIQGGSNIWGSFTINGSGMVTFAAGNGNANDWGQKSGLTCEDDCATTIADGILAFGPSSTTSGWSKVTVGNSINVSHTVINGTDFGGTIEFFATDSGTSATPIIDTGGAIAPQITTDGDLETGIDFLNPNNLANPDTWVNIGITQSGGEMTAVEGGTWNDVRLINMGPWTIKDDAGDFNLAEGATFKTFGGVRVGGNGGSGADLNSTDNATNRIITGIGNSTAEYLDIGNAGLLQFTSGTGFGAFVYQNIEVTGVVNLGVAGGTSTSCDQLVPAGNSYGISHSDANFSGGRLNITADNPPQAGFSVTLVTSDPDASISNDFTTINKPAGTSHVFNASKWTLTDP
jgi:hypothetical protein